MKMHWYKTYLTQGTVTSTMRKAEHPPECAGAGCSATECLSFGFGVGGWDVGAREDALVRDVTVEPGARDGDEVVG